MSWQYVQRKKMQRTAWGSFKLWAWDVFTDWMLFFDIQAGPIPKSWSRGL